MLIVLVGARGAGKTTLQHRLAAEGVTVLQPSTTRRPRSRSDREYDFVRSWNPSLYAWSIQVGTETYGMRKAELQKAHSCDCVTMFEPLNLQVFEGVRRSLGMDTITVGLATIADLGEQSLRVGGDPKRLMTKADFDKTSEIVAECDVVLSGDENVVADAMLAMLSLLRSRGGVVTKDYLQPMIAAGAFVTPSDLTQVRSASYDLRIGSEILCRGKITQLSPTEPHFRIPAYSYAIVSALEHASLPPFVIARFDLKVGMFFDGLILSNGPQVDPGYKGALFCMLYNGSGQEKLIKYGAHFATIDFATTTSVTEGYRQKYQLKQKMDAFVTDTALTGRGGEIVDLVDRKVGVVDKKVANIQGMFWTVASVFIALAIILPSLVIPKAWSEIDRIRDERDRLESVTEKAEEALAAARREREATSRLLQSARTRSLPSNSLR